MIIDLIAKAVVLGALIYAWRSLIRRTPPEIPPDHREGIQ